MKNVIVENLRNTIDALRMTMPIVSGAKEYARGYENGLKYAIDMIEWYEGESENTNEAWMAETK